MKAKVQLIDSFSGRSINVVANLVNTEFDKYEFAFESLSDYQRKKIEDFFGAYNAYYTNVEVLQIYKK